MPELKPLAVRGPESAETESWCQASGSCFGPKSQRSRGSGGGGGVASFSTTCPGVPRPC